MGRRRKGREEEGYGRERESEKRRGAGLVERIEERKKDRGDI